MSSKRRLRRKQCEGKIRYPTKLIADVYCHGKWKVRIQLRSYRCHFCGSWHVGHLRRPVAAKRNL